MSVIWTIAGEAGKALDATSRTLEAMNAEGTKVRFTSGKGDWLRWQIPLPNADGTGILAPELRQSVTLYRDGARYFTGHCIRRRPLYNGVTWSMQIEIAGPWWWLEQITLTSTQEDQAGNNATRAAIAFGTGDLRASFLALGARAIALGAPMTVGAVATMYSIPRLTITGSSVGSGYLDLQRWVPDAMMPWDYSGVGLPALKVTRRKTGLAVGSAATRTITLGTDNVDDLDLQPMIELEVASVRTDSADRDSQGRGIWVTALDGAPTTGQNQIVIISGPETIDTNLPQDTFDSVTVRSKPIKPSGSLTSEIFEIYDSRIRAAGATGLGLGPLTINNLGGGGSYTLPIVPSTVEKKDGGALPLARTRFLTLGEPKDWWTRDGIGWEMARASATMHTTVLSPVPVPNQYSPNAPDYVETLGMQHVSLFRSVSGQIQQVDIFYISVAVLFPAVDTAWTSPTTIYRAEDYAFANPPAGLAANLLAAQNFVPYEGEVTVIHEDIPAGNPVGTCVNIANGPAELAGVRAMVQAAEMDIGKGREKLTLGASPRLSYEDLVRRFRRTGYDSFDFISNKGLTPAP